MTAQLDRRSALILAASVALASRRVLAAPATARGPSMTSTIQRVCAAYLDAWQRKDIDALLACLHPDVQFKSPTAATSTRQTYASGALRFFALFDRIDIRAKLFSEDTAMFALDFNCIKPIGVCPTAELIRFKDGLIHEDEIFFDARPFEALAGVKAAAFSAN